MCVPLVLGIEDECVVQITDANVLIHIQPFVFFVVFLWFLCTGCAEAGNLTREKQKARDGRLEREMSHFVCQTLLFSTKLCYFHS